MMKKYFTARFARGRGFAEGPAFSEASPKASYAQASAESAEKKKSLLPLRPRRLCGEKINSFTLIELMIVMVVIAMLAGITIPIAKYATYRARQASQKIYIEKIKSALEDYRAKYGEYPITPATNDAGQVLNYDDVLRHYPANYATKCHDTTNSPFTNVNLAASNIEIMQTDDATYLVDYGLTYPLMLRQLLEGTQPFMDDFKELTVTCLVYNPVEIKGVDVFDSIIRRKKKGGGIETITKQYILGKPINRYKAIDPLTRMQWKYASDGITYNLTNHTAAEGF